MEYYLSGEISQTVEYYLQNSITNKVKRTTIEAKHRKSVAQKMLN